MTNFWKTTLAAAAVSLATVAAAQAGTVVDAANVFSIQGNTPGIVLLDGATLNPTGSFNTAFDAEGVAYLGGRVFISGQDDGILSGNYLRSYDLAGNPLDSEYGASFVGWGPLAAGNGQLFAGVTANGLDGAVYSLRSYNTDLTQSGLLIDLPEEATGIAFSGGNLFVSFGSNIRRYDLAGNLLDSHDYGVSDITGLTYGANTLFAAFAGGNDGWAAINPLMLWASGGASVETDDPITGLTFGDNSLFVATEFTVARYGLDGTLLDSLDSKPVVSHGPLAFIPTGGGRDTGAVPEPGTWALMILGFGGAGMILRRRRPVVAA